MIMRPTKAIRKPGKSGPAVFAFSDPRPLLRDFTKNIDAKAKPSTSTSPNPGLASRGFYDTDVFGASPVASALDQHTGRGPSMSGFTLSCRVTNLHAANRIFLQMESSFLPNAMLGSKTTLEYRNGYEKAQTGGCYRSTEFVIVVSRLSWRNFLPKKSGTSRERH